MQFDFPEWTHDKYLNAFCSSDALDSTQVVLLLPQTMMNRSGESVQAFLKRHPEEMSDLVVVQDELDLPVGRLKMVFERGAGGHHGVESIIAAVGGKDFTRLRIGIAPFETSDNALHVERGRDFVLGRFQSAEEEVMQSVFTKSVEALATLVRDGKENAMQRCNTSM
jgi:PTH1 family peptidyl-tRNA hydrolase